MCFWGRQWHIISGNLCQVSRYVDVDVLGHWHLLRKLHCEASIEAMGAFLAGGLDTCRPFAASQVM